MTAEDNIQADRIQDELNAKRQQYTNLVARYGNIMYQIAALSKDAKLMEAELARITDEIIAVNAKAVQS